MSRKDLLFSLANAGGTNPDKSLQARIKGKWKTDLGGLRSQAGKPVLVSKKPRSQSSVA